MLAKLSHAWADDHDLHVAYLKPIDTLAGAFHPATVLHPIGLGSHTFSALRKAYIETKPEIIHTHLVHADFFGLLAAGGLPAKKFSTAHNAHFRTGLADVPFQLGYQALYGSLASQTEVVAISQSVAAHAQQAWGVAPSRVHMVLNPLTKPTPVLSREEARAILGLPADQSVFTFLGRLEPQKGLIYLLQALAAIQAERQLPTVYIVGEGALDNALRQEADSLGLIAAGKVCFVGLTDQPGLYLAASNALLLPSLFEGLGNVIAEAFSCGIPVIASQIEGPAEVIDHLKTGLLIPPADAKALAKAIVDLMDNTALGAEMGRQAAQKAENWPSYATYAARLLSIYSK
jgi:glycosyltransferase involved in cell wall biosynthesis